MTSIDNTNAALYSFLHANSALLAAATGDIWDTKAEEGTALPYGVFQRITGIPDYTYGGVVSSDRQTYMFKAYAEDSASKTGRETVAQIVDLAKAALTNAALSITGSAVLACFPTNDIPCMATGERGAETWQEGFYFDVVAA